MALPQDFLMGAMLQIGHISEQFRAAAHGFTDLHIAPALASDLLDIVAGAIAILRLPRWHVHRSRTPTAF